MPEPRKCARRAQAHSACDLRARKARQCAGSSSCLFLQLALHAGLFGLLACIPRMLLSISRILHALCIIALAVLDSSKVINGATRTAY
jgi:hypothetical protein